MLTADQFLKGKLVEMAWRFGSSYNCGYLGGVMIMNCLANRFRLGWGSWLDVLAHVPNFMAESEIPELKLTSVWEPNFVKLLHAVDGVFDGSAVDTTKGALYWADLNKIERDWFKKKVVDATREDGLRAHPIVGNMNSFSVFK